MGMASAFPKKEIKAGLPVMSEEPNAMSQSRARFLSKWHCSDEERGRTRVRKHQLCKEAGCAKASKRGPQRGYCKMHAKEQIVAPLNSSLWQPVAQALQPVARTLPPAKEIWGFRGYFVMETGYEGGPCPRSWYRILHFPYGIRSTMPPGSYGQPNMIHGRQLPGQ